MNGMIKLLLSQMNIEPDEFIANVKNIQDMVKSFAEKLEAIDTKLDAVLKSKNQMKE